MTLAYFFYEKAIEYWALVGFRNFAKIICAAEQKRQFSRQSPLPALSYITE
jgi:hypothetical protein